MIIQTRLILLVLRIYLAVALIAGAVLSPLPFSFIPIVLLLVYLYFWWWPVNRHIDLIIDLYLFFALPLLFSPQTGSFLSILFSIPVLFLIDHSLREAALSAPYYQTERSRSLTGNGRSLVLLMLVVMGISLLLGSTALALAGTALILYLLIRGFLVFKGMPTKPVEEKQVQLRIVAGTVSHTHIEMNNKSRGGGRLFILSRYDWLKVDPVVLSLKDDRPAIKISLTPPLAGPALIRFDAYATDILGLTQARFDLEPIRLYVIPRAKYAAWLAKKYLENTRPGNLSIISNIQSLKPLMGLRRGIEYYGSRQYQPGDSLKNIDWKHSLKYNELISREFTEFHGRPALMLINLAVGSDEEKDKTAYKIIVTALSLARESVPTAISAYDHEGVKMVTASLHPQQLVLNAMAVARQLVRYDNPLRYLDSADIDRLKANISRLRFSENTASMVISGLLQLEYRSLKLGSRLNPATRALSDVSGRIDRQSNVVIISSRNHDGEALAFNTHMLLRKGNAVINV
jgi:type IV secretory pathway VirB2 component (pilin)